MFTVSTLYDACVALHRAIPAEGWERLGNEWSPDVHFTGTDHDPVEIAFIKDLLAQYDSHIVAYYLYSPLGPQTFSLELQFDDATAMRQCVSEYRRGFTRSGRTTKALRQRYAQVVAQDGQQGGAE